MKAAIFGLGSMGTKHYEILRQINEIEIVGLVDFCDMGDKFPLHRHKRYGNISDLFENEKQLDFAIISTPTSSHMSIAIEMAKRGIPILIEKPVAKSLSECLKLEEIVKQNGCKVAIGHIERYNPAVCAILDELDPADKIINCSFTRGSPYPARICDVGVKLDLSIHDVDLARYITGKEIIESKSQSFFSKSDNIEDTAMFSMKLEEGISVSILNSWVFPFRTREVKILTESSYYFADLLSQRAIKCANKDNLSYITKNLFVKRTNALYEEARDFIQFIRANQIGNLASLQDGIKALKITTAKEGV